MYRSTVYFRNVRADFPPLQARIRKKTEGAKSAARALAPLAPLMRALLLAGVALAAGVQNPALSLQTPAGVSIGKTQQSSKTHEDALREARKTRYSRKVASGRALNLAAPYANTDVAPVSAAPVSTAPVVPAVGEPLPDVPTYAVEPVTVEPSTGSSEPMSASRFADEMAKISNEVPPPQQQINAGPNPNPTPTLNPNP